MLKQIIKNNISFNKKTPMLYVILTSVLLKTVVKLHQQHQFLIKPMLFYYQQHWFVPKPMLM